MKRLPAILTDYIAHSEDENQQLKYSPAFPKGQVAASLRSQSACSNFDRKWELESGSWNGFFPGHFGMLLDSEVPEARGLERGSRVWSWPSVRRKLDHLCRSRRHSSPGLLEGSWTPFEKEQLRRWTISVPRK